ncbi:hypothetical protein HZH66_005621 [Vespula vulgaris]|uniref:Uncharacterized protein n=1 Tax=Vespula vulgaris TaxID=7454 RepID=A0A834K6R5_VESVU|nr:hypothetical protein HZH66_005621 [Vespula vulgaris]
MPSRCSAALAQEEGEEEEEEEGEDEAHRPRRRRRRRRRRSYCYLLFSVPLVFFLSSLSIADALPFHPVPTHKGITRRSYIRYYEPASYDTVALRRHRDRTRRDVSDSTENQPLLLRLKALDRYV